MLFTWYFRVYCRLFKNLQIWEIFLDISRWNIVFFNNCVLYGTSLKKKNYHESVDWSFTYNVLQYSKIFKFISCERVIRV